MLTNFTNPPIALRQRIPVGIGFHHDGTHAELVEQCSPGKGMMVFFAAFHSKPNQVVDPYGIGVAGAARHPGHRPSAKGLARALAAGSSPEGV